MSTVPHARSIITIADAEARKGAAAALAAYLVWGFFPLLFDQLAGVNPLLVVAHRIVWSLLLLTAIMLVSGRWREVTAGVRDRATMRTILISAPLLTVNWVVYVWAVENGKVLETSLGYFLTPLASVALGMAFFGERQRPLQAIAIGIAVIAMIVQAIGVGGVPWVAITLAISFSIYGYFHKTLTVSAAAGLLLETAVLVPVALGMIVYSLITDGAGPHADPRLMILLVLTGPATSLSLLLFGYSVQRLRLTTTGMFQYISPSIHFVLALLVFNEALNPTRLVSFALIWFSLIVFSADMLRNTRPSPAATA